MAHDLVVPENIAAAVETARLPENYQRAKLALAECEAVDQCLDWADRAAALATYARQAEDAELENYARRIRASRSARGRAAPRDRARQARAEICGGPHRSPQWRRNGCWPITRSKTWRSASPAYPRSEFEEAVGSDDPPGTERLLSKCRAVPVVVSTTHYEVRAPQFVRDEVTGPRRGRRSRRQWPPPRRVADVCRRSIRLRLLDLAGMQRNSTAAAALEALYALARR